MLNFINQNALINHMALALKSRISGSVAKDVYLMIGAVPVSFEYKEVKKGAKEQSVKGFYGGRACYNSRTKEYEIVIIIYNSIEERTVDECVNIICSSGLKEKAYVNIAFVYLHEMQHIFQKHLIFAGKYEAIARKMVDEAKNKAFPKNVNINSLLNIAMDYHINSYIKNLNIFDDVYKDLEKIDFLYEISLDAKKMNEMEMLKSIIENSNLSYTESLDPSLMHLRTEFNGKIRVITVCMDIEPSEKQNEPFSSADEDDLKRALDSAITKMKGAGLNNIMHSLGLPIAIEVTWINRLIAKLNTIAYGYSKSGRRDWLKPNYFFRAVNLPGRKSTNTDSQAYVAIDYSGSMSDVEIRKINYALEKLHDKGFDITVIGHTDKIGFISEFKRDRKKLKEFIKSRTLSGGTSHEKVFNYLEENMSGKQNVVILMSDMGSDIEEVWKRYEWHSKAKVVFIDTDKKKTSAFKSFVESTGSTYIAV